MTKPGYFPILDNLRFLASAGVFLAHSIVFFSFPGAGLHFPIFIVDAGYYGVIFFYTLSGFLITYLLMKEKKSSGTIAVNNFYVRRALRIWPLYYLIVLLSFFVFPYLVPGYFAGSVLHSKATLLLYLLFLPNIVVPGWTYPPTCFHTYTIGFEEQFYLFWPLVLRRSGRRFGIFLAALFVLPVLLEIGHLQIIAHGLPFRGTIVYGIRSVLSFINYSNMAAFVAGAMAAFFYLEGSEKLLRVAGKKIWRWILVPVTLLLMYFAVPRGLGFVNGVSLIFAFLILHLVRSEAGGGREGADVAGGSKLGSLLARGGKVSYGIYIYHPAVLIFVSYFMNRVHFALWDSALLTYIAYLLLSFVLLLLTAAVSYTYFERYFLRKKIRYQSPGSVPEGPGFSSR